MIVNKGLTVRTAAARAEVSAPVLLEHASKGELDASFRVTDLVGLLRYLRGNVHLVFNNHQMPRERRRISIATVDSRMNHLGQRG